MQTGKVGIGAIGTGARLTGLLKDLLARHGERCELRAMCDELPGALAAARENFGQDLPALDDFRRVVERPDVDWVMIGSMNSRHRDHCLAAFAAGKNVFCEKPLAVTIPECAEIREAHRRSGKMFATGFVLRCSSLYRKIHEMVTAGALGRIISMEANENLQPDHGGYIMRGWRRQRKYSGNHLLEKCSHDIDLINWLIDAVPSRVACFAGLDIFKPENKPITDRLKRPDDNPELYYAWPHWEKDNDPFLSDKDEHDNWVAILEYRNGARVAFHTNACQAWPQRRMLICGLEGSLECDLYRTDIQYKRIGRQTKLENIAVPATDFHGGGDRTIVDDLVQSMLTGARPTATGEEGFRSAVTCLAIDEARAKGQVVDLEPYWKMFGV